MKHNHYAVLALGFIGGVLGAYTLLYFDRNHGMGSQAMAATTMPASMITSSRIRLVDDNR